MMITRFQTLMIMNSAGRLLSTTLLLVFVLIAVVPNATLAITTTHHDKPEEAQPIQMASKMRTTETHTLNTTTTLATSERQKRLLPYMTFYLEQDFNRPHGLQHQQPQQLQPSAPTSYATTGAIKQPTILQHYHNKFTELTNGISYQPASKFVEVASQKIKLTPFLDSNALPGPFFPMRLPPNVVQPTKATYTTSGNKAPNYSAIYDKLSQLKLQQQYQLGHYNRHYPSAGQQQIQQIHVQQVPHSQHLHAEQHTPHFQQQQQPHQGSYLRKQPQIQLQLQPQLPAQEPQQVQQVSYIPIRDYVHGYKTSPAKTIVQTYTASSIDIPSGSGNNKDNNINNSDVDDGSGGDDGNSGPDNQERYERLPPTGVKTYNEQVKNYGPIHIHQHQQPPPPQQVHHDHIVPLTNEERQQYFENKYGDGEVKKHVLKPVILVRQKPISDNINNAKPYLIIQRKPTSPQKSPYNIELQIPETLNFRPIKYQHNPNIKYQDDEVGKIIVESVTPKYIDIIPKYEVKPTLLTHIAPTFAKPYSPKYGPHQGPPHHVPQPPPPPSPQPHVTYQGSNDYKDESQHQGDDYVDTDDGQVKYEKPKYQLEYDSENDDRPVSTKQPLVTYIDRPSKYVHTQQPPHHVSSENENTANAENSEGNQSNENYVKYIPTAKPTYQTKPLVYAPTPVPTKPIPEPEYQEGTNSLNLILKKLQDTNALPQTLTPDNIDNSIRTLVKILSSLKKQPKFQKPIVVADDTGEYEGNNEAGVGLGEVPGTVTQIFPENTPEGGTPGTPGVDYPALATIPQTDFNCKTQRYKGFFGDPDTNCQVWHYCDLNGGQASFLCPNGTIFSQVALTCDWWYNVKCSNTAQLYVLNERLYKYILPLSPKFPEDYSGPLVDRYLALKFQEMEEKMKNERKKNKEESDKGAVSATSKEASGEQSKQDNEAVQDDAEELREETRKQHETHNSPIIVPDESNETTTSAEN